MSQDYQLSTNYLPVFFKRGDAAESLRFDALVQNAPEISVLDLYASQKKELYKIRNPRKKLSTIETGQLYSDWLQDKKPENEGVWVYYSWSKRLIHILDKSEFIELRTSRNQYKITPEEQQSLFNKCIGILGLSVGHSVALCTATERICGKLKLADFDTIELSNLNRIRTGIHNIGLNKCVVAAREIAEIDPFLEIECFEDGLTEANMSAFFTGGGHLDILVEECDDIQMKISCRQMARELRIPVVMETSDRGMLDVERFDLEADRPIFHGLLKDIPPAKLTNITEDDKLPLVLKIVNALNGSKRGKVSLLEIGQTIGTWPQLASSVSSGGAVVTDVCRRILLNQYSESGRYYVDIEELVGNKPVGSKPEEVRNPFKPFSLENAINLADSLIQETATWSVDTDQIREIVAAACQAPSTGNDQPWKWVYRHGRLHLFHDQYRSYSFGDFDNIASNISFGASYENLLLKSHALGLQVKASFFPLGVKSTLIATIDFHQDAAGSSSEPVFSPESVHAIYTRTTNRNPSTATELSDLEIGALKSAAESINGATFYYISERQKMFGLGEIIGECDRIRLLNVNGHHDFVEREMKWTKEEAENSKDGIDIRTLGMNSAQMAALSIIRDGEISKALKRIKGGSALIDVTLKTISTASALGIITLPEYSYENFFLGGMSMQRLWLKAEELQFAIHPVISPFYLFPRVTHGHGEGLDQDEASSLVSLRKRFLDLVPIGEKAAGVFLFKIAKAQTPKIKSYRLPLDETLFIANQKI